MPEHRAGEDGALNFLTQGDKLFRLESVADVARVLGDDRTFIEVRSDIMGGGPNHLHPARMSLMVWLGALEAGQKAVVDVDAATRQGFAQRRRQDLHVSG